MKPNKRKENDGKRENGIELGGQVLLNNKAQKNYNNERVDGTKKRMTSNLNERDLVINEAKKNQER